MTKRFSVNVEFVDGTSDKRLFSSWLGAYISAQDLYDRKNVRNVVVLNPETGEVHYIANENFVNEPAGLGRVFVCQ